MQRALVSQLRPLMIEASQYDTALLLAEWAWLVPDTATPLFLSAFGDWVFGDPDGSIWVLSVLEGTYERVAATAGDYDRLQQSQDWLEETFLSGWQPIAAAHGLEPAAHECLGWKIHPLIGGKFEPANLQLFSMVVYQSLMGQFHRQLHQSNVKP
ncbi:MAG TPA: hypothetical protein VH858_01895 [Hyphomicrobiales bacterium]